MLFHHDLYLVSKHFHHVQVNLLSTKQFLPIFFLPPAPNIHQSVFCLHVFVCSVYFVYMESCNTWHYVPGFFHLAQCSQGSSLLCLVSLLHPFSGPSNIPLYVCAIICLSTPSLMDIWAPSIFWLLWISLLYMLGHVFV